MTNSFFHGIFLAFGLILPLGPQNMFVFFQGANQHNLLNALPIAVAASLSDTTLILLAIFGVSTVVLTVPSIKIGLIIAGILFLSYMGWISWRTNTLTNYKFNNVQNWSLKKKIVFTLSVSLLNPHAILDTIGVIGTTSLSYTEEAKIAFTIGCLLVSWNWFLFLIVAGRLVGKFTHFMQFFNKFSAVIMWISAVYLIKNLI